MTCDICGEKGTFPAMLFPAYATKDIKHICPDCELTANKQLAKIKHVTHNITVHWFRRFLEQLKKKKQPERDT